MIELWKILFQKRFDSESWKNSTEHRKYYYKDICTMNLIGRSKQEIIELFGDDRNYSYEDKWRYFLYKNTWRNKVYYLTFHFDNDKVTNTKIAFKAKRKRI